MVGQVAVRHERADAQPPARGFLDSPEWQMRDVDEPPGALNIVLHQVQYVGAPSDESGVRIGSDLSESVADIGRLGKLKVDHGLLLIAAMACWIAATILGYAPQRQILPLISSRISSSVCARPSLIRATADMIWPGV